jgi:hypothetical protein
MSNLYKSLGIENNATPEEIKKAYRAKAKRNHPDAGGDKEKMNEIIRAYEVLSNADRRANYDETGSTEAPLDEIESAARVQFFEMLTEIFLKQEKVNFGDFLKKAKREIDAIHAKQRQEIKDLEKLIAAARARIIKAPEPDLLGALLAQQEEGARLRIKAIEKAEAIDARSLAYFEGYLIKDPDPRPAYQGYGMSIEQLRAAGFAFGPGFGATTT